MSRRGDADWRDAFRQVERDPARLGQSLGHGSEQLSSIADAAEAFPFRVTEHYLSLADPTDPDDPILKQILPNPLELAAPPKGYRDDAVGDLSPTNHPAPGLVHKYPGRALLVTTGTCAVNCRFCFRRNYPYDELRDSGAPLEAALQVVADDPSIAEVILSGGDPLSLTDAALGSLVTKIAGIPHVRRLRVHTRMPVVLPQRVTESLLLALGSSRLSVWIVTHFNHPRELAPAAIDACRAFSEAGMPVLNQSVLLKGVNDDVEVLTALCEGLVDGGIKPYYLHRLDRVRGVAHFDVPEDVGLALHAALRERVSGIALPAFVEDDGQGPSKRPAGLRGRASGLTFLLLALGLVLGLGTSCKTESVSDAAGDQPHSEKGDVAEPQPKLSSKEAESSSSAERKPSSGATLPPLESADQVLVADLDGDGAQELLVASGNEVRWGTWPTSAPAPSLHGRMTAEGRLQAWHASDLDGDGRDEVVAAFGIGRGFPKAPLEVILLDQQGSSTIVLPLWKDRGPRNQATAVFPWPRPDGTFDVYLSAFESRFVVRGGVLSRSGAEPRWLESHRLRMGMARAAGDFDGDGVPEVAVGRLYGEDASMDGDLRVLQEDGSFEMVPTVRGVRAVGAQDIDGDGKDELLFGDGWHKNYGKLARYRPSVGRRAGDGVWRVQLVEEQATQYAVEKIDFGAGRLVAGGNGEVTTYQPSGDGWQRTAVVGPSSANGTFALLPDGGVIVGGAAPRRWVSGGGLGAQTPTPGP